MPKMRMFDYAGPGFEPLRATIPAHALRIVEDGAPANEVQVKWWDDGFVEIFTYPVGAIIERIGPGAQGILRRPPDYCGSGSPVLGEVYAQIKTSAGTGTSFRVQESENQLV